MSGESRLLFLIFLPFDEKNDETKKDKLKKESAEKEDEDNSKENTATTTTTAASNGLESGESVKEANVPEKVANVAEEGENTLGQQRISKPTTDSQQQQQPLEPSVSLAPSLPPAKELTPPVDAAVSTPLLKDSEGDTESLGQSKTKDQTPSPADGR